MTINQKDELTMFRLRHLLSLVPFSLGIFCLPVSANTQILVTPQLAACESQNGLDGQSGSPDGQNGRNGVSGTDCLNGGNGGNGASNGGHGGNGGDGAGAEPGT